MSYTFFWSDLHIGHARLAEQWRTSFGGTVEAHNAMIAARWNATVGPTDEVVVVGDACMGPFADSLAFFAGLNGTKFLIPGNHDRMHPSAARTETKRENATARYRDAGIQVVSELIVPGGWFGLDPSTIICHFPWSDTPDHAEERDLIRAYGPERDRVPNDRYVVVHGHTHSTERTGNRSVHVGVDAFPDGPVPVDEVRRLVEAVR